MGLGQLPDPPWRKGPFAPLTWIYLAYGKYYGLMVSSG